MPVTDQIHAAGMPLDQTLDTAHRNPCTVVVVQVQPARAGGAAARRHRRLPLRLRPGPALPLQGAPHVILNVKLYVGSSFPTSSCTPASTPATPAPPLTRPSAARRVLRSSNAIVVVTSIKMHAVIDACHSGSALDSPFRCKARSAAIERQFAVRKAPAAHRH